MKAILLTIGDELTSGQTVDSNSAHIARELARRGIETLEHRTIADERAAISQALLDASTRADLVVVTGGLGPTADDVTRDALADAMGAELVLDESALHRVKKFFRKIGRPMSDANRVQAMVPRGAEAMENQAGTAPGLYARLGEAQVFLMPGVPREMKWMLHHGVLSRLGEADGVIAQHVLHTFGAGESDVGAAIRHLMSREGPVTVGTTVAAGLVSVRITGRAKTVPEAQTLIERRSGEIRDVLGALVFGEQDDTLASVAGKMLKAKGQTLATAESCTGGLVGQMLTAVPGASDYYLGGVVAYSNPLKHNLLGVPESLLAEHGAVSEPVATAMAEGIRERTGSDWAVSLTGIAGPTGGSGDKPVGLVFIAVADPGSTQVHRRVFPGNREFVRLRSALAALNHVRLALLGGEGL